MNNPRDTMTKTVPQVTMQQAVKNAAIGVCPGCGVPLFGVYAAYMHGRGA